MGIRSPPACGTCHGRMRDDIRKTIGLAQGGAQCLISKSQQGAGNASKETYERKTGGGNPGRGSVVSLAWRRICAGCKHLSGGEGITVLAVLEWLKTRGSRMESNTSAEGFGSQAQEFILSEVEWVH